MAVCTKGTGRLTVGYARVSTDEQAEHGFGIRAQVARLQGWAQAMDRPFDRIVKDDGYSGGTLERPGLQELLGLIRSGQVETVVVAKLDRLSRSLKNLLVLFADEFEANGTALVSVSEAFDTSSPSGRLFFQMIGSFAEFERNVITERTSGGRKQKAQRGGYSGGAPALGYSAARGSKVLALDEQGAAAVRRIFQLHDEDGMDTPAIAARLNAEGYKTARGAEFTKVQVWRTLKRRALYEGRYTYAGVEAAKGEQAAILPPTQAAAF